MSFRSYWALYRTSHSAYALYARSLLAVWALWHGFGVPHLWGIKGDCISSHFRPAHQHYTDEAQKAETVPSVVRYRSMSFSSYWALYRTSHCRLRIVRTLTACSLSALAWFWCPTFVRHQRWLYKQSLSSCSSALHWCDEAQKAETVPSVVRYRSMSFRSYWVLYRTSHCRLRIVRTLTACSLSALAWFWCPTFVKHQRWLYKQSLSSCSSALHWWGPKGRNGTVCS